VLVVGWLLSVVDSCQGIQCSCDLEHIAHFVLNELLWFAVVIEAMLAQVVCDLLELTIEVKHVVHVVKQAHDLCEVVGLEVIQVPLEIVQILH